MNKNSSVILLVLIAVTQNSCQKSDDDKLPSGSEFAISLASHSTLGQYLVDHNGQTLYFFSDDYNGENSCSGQCEDFWPYFDAGVLTQADLGAGLDLGDFERIEVGSTHQTRYKGWPLYYYAPQGTSLEPAGQVTGELVPNWLVAKPDYTVMLANAQLVGMDGKNYLNTYEEGVGKTVYFTDAFGVTLYTFVQDSFNINKYTLPDFSNDGVWPVYDTTKIVVPSTLDKSLFNSIDVHGRKQLTYKGWPLYYFGPDNNIQGNTKGVSVPSPGIWPVAEKGINPAPQE